MSGRRRAVATTDLPRLAVALDRGRVLLLRAAFHRDADAAQAAWDTLVRDAGGALEVMRWANRGAERRLLPALGARAELLELPTEVTRACRDAHAEAWGLNERLLALVEPAVAALVDRGIPTVALKGVALLGDVFPRHALRPIGDVDLLVPRRRAVAALRILDDAGWRGPRRHRPWWLAGRHAVNLGTDVVGPSIDLHWRPSRSTPHRVWVQPWPAPDLEPVPTGHPFAGSGLLRARPERLLVQIASHGVQADNPTLSHWVADLARLIEAHPDLDGAVVARVGAEDRLSLEVQAALRTCAEVLGVEAPFPLRLLDPSSTAAERDEVGRWRAAVAIAGLDGTPGVRAALRRFLAAGRSQTLRRDLVSRLQVAAAVASTWWDVRRPGPGAGPAPARGPR